MVEWVSELYLLEKVCWGVYFCDLEIYLKDGGRERGVGVGRSKINKYCLVYVW